MLFRFFAKIFLLNLVLFSFTKEVLGNNSSATISSIRPSKSNHPFTLKENNFQLETGIYLASRDKNNDHKETIKSVFDSTNLRFGIKNNLEFNLIFSPFLSQEISGKNHYINQSYSSDLEINLRYNIFGNDEKNDQKSFALIPIIILPTSSSDSDANNYQAGLVFQYFQKLVSDFNLLLSFQPRAKKDLSDKNHRLTAINIINLNKEIYPKLNAFIEFYNSKKFANKTVVQNSFDFGFIYQVRDNLSIDFAVYLAASDASPDQVFQFGYCYLF